MFLLPMEKLFFARAKKHLYVLFIYSLTKIKKKTQLLCPTKYILFILFSLVLNLHTFLFRFLTNKKNWIGRIFLFCEFICDWPSSKK